MPRLEFMFKSPKNFLIGAGMVAGSAAAMVATGGALAPVLLTVGVGMSALQVGVGVNKILKAKNGDDTEKAFVDIGAGSSGIGLSLLSAKASLKQSHMVINDLDPFQANLAVKSVNPIKALIQNIKMVPEALIETKNTIKDGSALARLVNWVTFRKPNVAIVDDFTEKLMDIDGDLKPDIAHGRAVEVIIKGTHKGAKSINIDASSPNPKGRGFTSKDLTKAFKDIASKVDKGEKIDAVNVSIGNDFSIEGFGPVLKKLSTRGNLAENRTIIKNFLKNPDPKFFKDPETINILKEKYSIIEALESLTKKGVKVYISGGNGSPDKFNYMNLADGTINVGATNATGTKMPYSADSKIINKFAQGTKSVTPVVKKKLLQGYDITGSGKVEVPVNETTGGPTFISKFVGKQAKDLILDNKDFENILTALKEVRKNPNGHIPGHVPPKYTPQELIKMMDKFGDKLISSKKYADLLEASSSKVPLESLSKLRNSNQLVNIKGKPFFFDTNQKGVVVFNPDGSGRAAVSVIHGTSFSTPRALGLDLNKNFANLNTASNYTKSSLGSTLNTSNPFRLLNNKSKNS